jgi:hypothetical protein
VPVVVVSVVVVVVSVVALARTWLLGAEWFGWSSRVVRTGAK